MRWAALALAAPLATACFTSSPSGPLDAGGADGPAPPEPDATMDATMEATADAPGAEASVEASPEAAIEAGPIDAGVDSAVDVAADVPVEATAGAVTVTVVGPLGPEQGVPVVWQDASGASVATSVTDAQGTATQVVSGGMVTALMGSPSQPSLYTVMAIQPGDQLVVVDWASLSNLTPGPVVDLTSIPAPPAGTAGYSFYSGHCTNGFSTTPVTMSLLQSMPCIGVGRFGSTFGAAYPALVEANDANGALLGFTFSRDNPITTPDDAGYFDLALGGGAWSTATTSQMVTVQNQPDAGVNRWWLNYQEAADGVLTPLPTRLPPDGGTLAPNEALFTAHQGYPEFVQTELTVQPDTAGIDVLHAGFALVSRGAPPTADASLAINWTPLTTMPALIGTTVDATVVTRPAVTWTTGAGTLASVTGVLVTALWTGTDPEGGFQRGSWTMVSPGTAQASLQAPTLPTALGAWAPIPASSFQISTVYAIDGGTALPGYAQLRATSSIFQLQTQCIFAPMAPALPLPGSLMMSGFTSGFCG